MGAPYRSVGGVVAGRARWRQASRASAAASSRASAQVSVVARSMAAYSATLSHTVVAAALRYRFVAGTCVTVSAVRAQRASSIGSR